MGKLDGKVGIATRSILFGSAQLWADAGQYHDWATSQSLWIVWSELGDATGGSDARFVDQGGRLYIVRHGRIIVN